MPVDRLSIKWQVIVKHGGPHNARCDGCGTILRLNGESGELHEFVAPRARTKKGGAARDASYAAELCALLCNQCHYRVHSVDGSDEDRDYFAQVNYGIYGEARVRHAYARLQSLAKSPLPYRLPKAA
jgi:hypothetical protein